MTPRVAVVIPTHQRRRSLAQVLDRLSKQSCPTGFFMAVIVCDGCTDGTVDMVRATQYPFEIQVLEQWPGQGPAAARNRALSVIQAPILLFLDDDVVPDENLVMVHAAHHAADPDVVVIGPLLRPTRRQQPWIRWEAETLRDQYAEMVAGAWTPTPRQFYTGNASVGSRHVLEAGGFDARLSRGEDVDLAFRLQRGGLQFRFDPAARGIHIARRSFRSWVAAAQEYGRTEVAMGPVWGTKGLVDVKVCEFRRRHAIVRRAVGLALANPRLMPVLVATGRVLGWVLAAVGLWSVARGVYTAIFEIAYWTGVEKALGLSGGVLEGNRSRTDRESQKAV